MSNHTPRITVCDYCNEDITDKSVVLRKKHKRACEDPIDLVFPSGTVRVHRKSFRGPFSVSCSCNEAPFDFQSKDAAVNHISRRECDWVDPAAVAAAGVEPTLDAPDPSNAGADQQMLVDEVAINTSLVDDDVLCSHNIAVHTGLRVAVCLTCAKAVRAGQVGAHLNNSHSADFPSIPADVDDRTRALGAQEQFPVIDLDVVHDAYQGLSVTQGYSCNVSTTSSPFFLCPARSTQTLTR
jgi:hypothetical protein